MITLQTKILNNAELTYDGTQLAPHWILKTLDMTGDAIVAFIGKADVKVEHMVDLHDVKSNAPIYSPRMLHFLGEFFIDSLETGILLQNLFVMQVYSRLLERGVQGLSRRGNDIFIKGRKLSVSIATKSPVSILIHMGLNIETEGCPVPASGLHENGVDPLAFAAEVLEKTAQDFASYRAARCKVTAR